MSLPLIVNVVISSTIGRVEAYFNFTPLANRMFHAPTFLASLSLPPTHPKFPLPAVLHAMCAVGSMYTAAITHMPSGTQSLSTTPAIYRNHAQIPAI